MTVKISSRCAQVGSGHSALPKKKINGIRRCISKVCMYSKIETSTTYMEINSKFRLLVLKNKKFLIERLKFLIAFSKNVLFSFIFPFFLNFQTEP